VRRDRARGLRVLGRQRGEARPGGGPCSVQGVEARQGAARGERLEQLSEQAAHPLVLRNLVPSSRVVRGGPGWGRGGMWQGRTGERGAGAAQLCWCGRGGPGKGTRGIHMDGASRQAQPPHVPGVPEHSRFMNTTVAKFPSTWGKLRMRGGGARAAASPASLPLASGRAASGALRCNGGRRGHVRGLQRLPCGFSSRMLIATQRWRRTCRCRRRCERALRRAPARRLPHPGRARHHWRLCKFESTQNPLKQFLSPKTTHTPLTARPSRRSRSGAGFNGTAMRVRLHFLCNKNLST
jgi:hypothetical protein